jgi:zinc/manganese transport system substrate-binding protein
MVKHRSAYLSLACPIIVLLLLSACGSTTTGSSSSSNTASSSTVINVVAAENFYGDITKQLGGSHVAVTSILSDPNVDPHEYESNVQTAETVSKAQLVIENGLGYDAWMDKLLSASPNSSRLVLVAGNVADHKLPDNPHIWYGFDNVATIATAITAVLKKLDSADSSIFDNNLVAFKQSLAPLVQKISGINSKYKGTPVALTETIYLYQSTPEGLDVLTPFEFEKAIAEGNDPPADTVTTTNDQITRKQVKILIYNVQTITPITTNLQNEARSLNMPIVPVSETMPPGKTYQTWMMNQLNNLEQALASATGK